MGGGCVPAGGWCFGWCLARFAFVLFVEYVDAVGEELFGGGLSCRKYSDEVGQVVGGSGADAPDSDEGES